VLNKDEIIPFQDKFVSVGVPHHRAPNTLFFYYGFLREIDSEEVKLETKFGFKIIKIVLIQDIHLTIKRWK
jgi:hypothetical protein